MTTTLTSDVASLKANRLPAWAPYLVGVVAAAAAYAVIYVGKQLGGGVAMTVIAAVILFLILLAITSRIVEGPRAARNRVMTTAIYTAFALAALPLISVAQTLIRNGVSRIDGDFFTHSMRGVTPFDAQGGAYHAIVGTLEQAGIAAAITIPLGIATAVYIVEYGRGRLVGIVHPAHRR